MKTRDGLSYNETMAEIETITISVPEVKPPEKENEFWLTPKQELFCQYYVKNKSTFGNGTISYAMAYGFDLDNADRTLKLNEGGNPIPKSSEYDKMANGCAVSASQLLRNFKIDARNITLLNELLRDEVVDSELSMVIRQKRQLGDKMRAIQEYNKMRGRHAPEKVEQSGKVIVEVTNYGSVTVREKSGDPVQLSTEMVSTPDSSKPGEIPSDSPSSPVREVKDGPQPADSKGDGEPGALSVSSPDLQTGEKSDLARPGNDEALPSGDSPKKE